MDNGIVDAATTESTAGSDFLYDSLIRGEQIQSERMGHGLNLGDSFIRCLVSQHWQNRAKDLLSHNGILEGNVIHNRRSNLQTFRVGFSTDYNFRWIYQRTDTLKMFLIDDLSIVDIV